MTQTTEDLAVLFVDICGSTQTYEKLGDEKGRQALTATIDILRETVETSGGTIVDQIGDELMCTFPDGAAASGAAANLHGAVFMACMADKLPSHTLVRIGFHAGPVLMEDGRIFGSTVHIARRVGSLAKAEQILTTRETADADPGADLRTRFVDRTHVKGISEAIEVVEIVWDKSASTFAATFGALDDDAGPQQALVVEHGDDVWELGASRPTLSVGRGAYCDVVIEHEAVSRLHARLEYRKGSFVYVDESTNGSRVLDSSGTQRSLRRGECALQGKGTITLGPTSMDAELPTIVFRRESASAVGEGGTNR